MFSRSCSVLFFIVSLATFDDNYYITPPLESQHRNRGIQYLFSVAERGEQERPVPAVQLRPVALVGELRMLGQQTRPVKSVHRVPLVASVGKLGLPFKQVCPVTAAHLLPLVALVGELRLFAKQVGPVFACQSLEVDFPVFWFLFWLSGMVLSPVGSG